MIGQTRIIELNPADRETGSLGQLLKQAARANQNVVYPFFSRNEGLIISSEQFRHVEVLPDGNLRIAY